MYTQKISDKIDKAMPIFKKELERVRAGNKPENTGRIWDRVMKDIDKSSKVA